MNAPKSAYVRTLSAELEPKYGAEKAVALAEAHERFCRHKDYWQFEIEVRKIKGDPA